MVYVSYGKDVYRMEMGALTVIGKEIVSEESTLGRKLNDAERKHHFDAHVQVKEVSK